MNIIEANVATPDARVAITIARFNNFINDSLLEGAIDALKRIGQVKMKTSPSFGFVRV
nr:6,7-dimethyl-8-ribityllumazine synthase [Klebsiella pneumoniae]